jgi:hypothetical protein
MLMLHVHVYDRPSEPLISIGGYRCCSHDSGNGISNDACICGHVWPANEHQISAPPAKLTAFLFTAPPQPNHVIIHKDTLPPATTFTSHVSLARVFVTMDPMLGG